MRKSNFHRTWSCRHEPPLFGQFFLHEALKLVHIHRIFSWHKSQNDLPCAKTTFRKSGQTDTRIFWLFNVDGIFYYCILFSVIKIPHLRWMSVQSLGTCPHLFTLFIKKLSYSEESALHMWHTWLKVRNVSQKLL